MKSECPLFLLTVHSFCMTAAYASKLLDINTKLGLSVQSKQIIALAGLAPFNHDSGLIGIRTIWGVRASIRSPMYMAALLAVKHTPKIRVYYQRICEAGKPKK